MYPPEAFRVNDTVEPSSAVKMISVASTRAAVYDAPAEARWLNVQPRGTIRASGANQLFGMAARFPDEAIISRKSPLPDGFV